ncbi:MAG: LPXTG cell wall anchor domain-containing protein [Acidobacteriota bacterium]
MIQKTLLTIAAAAVLIGTSVTAKADDFDKKTSITVNQPLLIPGKTLPPGKYVIKLLNATANRHVVQIYNEDQTHMEAMILAFNNYRLTPTDKTVLTYWETPAGSPPALRAWFFPGDNYGQEFAYPKETAELLARQNNNAKVPQYDAPASTTAFTDDQLVKLQVRDVPEEAAAVRQVAPAPVRQPAPRAVAAQVSEPAPAPRENVLLAQNTPQAAPLPDRTSQPAELPHTASSTPWILALGFMALGSALFLKLAKRA